MKKSLVKGKRSSKTYKTNALTLNKFFSSVKPSDFGVCGTPVLWVNQINSLWAYLLVVMVTRCRVRNRLPLRYHSIHGVGLPPTRQLKVNDVLTGAWTTFRLACTLATLAGGNKEEDE